MLRTWTSKCARWTQPPSMMQGPPELADVFQFVIDLNGSDMKMPTITSRSFSPVAS